MRVFHNGLMLSLVVIVVAACGGESSIPDYAADVESLVVTMNARLDEIDAEVEGSQDLEVIKRYAQERIAARSTLLTGMGNLSPPGDLKELHDAALEILERLTAAETAMVDRVMSWESAADIESIWDTPEGLAARSVDAQAVELCLAAESDFNRSKDRAKLEGVPWIPSDMKEVIIVALGCEAEHR